MNIEWISNWMDMLCWWCNLLLDIWIFYSKLDMHLKHMILMTNNIILYFIIFSNNFEMSLTKACRNSRICWVQTEIDCHYCKVQAMQCNLMYCKDISTQWTSKWKLWKWKSDVIVRYWTDQLSAHHWIIDSSTFWHSTERSESVYSKLTIFRCQSFGRLPLSLSLV